MSDVSEPGVLNDTCTAEFFDANGVVGDCRFDDDAQDVHAALAVDGVDLNLTVESDGVVQSVDGETLSHGRAPPSTADVVVARRVALLEDEHVTLYVRVW